MATSPGAHSKVALCIRRAARASFVIRRLVNSLRAKKERIRASAIRASSRLRTVSGRVLRAKRSSINSDMVGNTNEASNVPPSEE